MRKANIIVAMILMLVGFIVVADAIRLGFGWGLGGPEPGFFPLLMGLGVIICTFFIVRKGVRVYRKDGPGKRLIVAGGLTQILWVFIPASGMVLLTELVGLHLATVFYLAFSMGVVGKMRWFTVLLVSILVPFSVFIVFDKLFLIPLPEGLWGKYIIPF
jgi:hypothetical protein